MTLHLVRHGSAGRRNGADPKDQRRHLDDKGRRQAAAVQAHLHGEPVEAVLSSPLPRCVETVAPLADEIGLEVVLEPRLAEGADIGEAWALLEDLAGRTVVLCSHGDVIPELIQRNERRGTSLPKHSGFAKGSVWALGRWNGRRFETAAWDKLR